MKLLLILIALATICMIVSADEVFKVIDSKTLYTVDQENIRHDLEEKAGSYIGECDRQIISKSSTIVSKVPTYSIAQIDERLNDLNDIEAKKQDLDRKEKFALAELEKAKTSLKAESDNLRSILELYHYDIENRKNLDGENEFFLTLKKDLEETGGSKEKFQDVNDSLYEIEKKIIELDESIKASETDINAIEENIDDLQSHVTSLKNELSELKDKKTDIKDDAERIEEENCKAVLQHDLLLQEEMKELEDILIKTQNDIEENEEVLKIEELELNKLVNDLTAAEAYVSQLNKDISEYEELLNELRQVLKENQKKLDDRIAKGFLDNDASLKLISDLRNEIHDIENERAEGQDSLQETKANIEENQREIKYLHHNITERTHQIHELREDYDNVEAKGKHLQDKYPVEKTKYPQVKQVGEIYTKRETSDVTKEAKVAKTARFTGKFTIAQLEKSLDRLKDAQTKAKEKKKDEKAEERLENIPAYIPQELLKAYKAKQEFYNREISATFTVIETKDIKRTKYKVKNKKKRIVAKLEKYDEESLNILKDDIARYEFAGTQYEGVKGFDGKLIEITAINGVSPGEKRRLLQAQDEVDFNIVFETENEVEATDFEAATGSDTQGSTLVESNVDILVPSDGEKSQAILAEDQQEFVVPAGIFSVDITAEGQNASKQLKFTVSTVPGDTIKAVLNNADNGEPAKRRLLAACDGATIVLLNGELIAVAAGGDSDGDGEGIDQDGNIVCGGTNYISGAMLASSFSAAVGIQSVWCDWFDTCPTGYTELKSDFDPFLQPDSSLYQVSGTPALQINFQLPNYYYNVYATYSTSQCNVDPALDFEALNCNVIYKTSINYVEDCPGFELIEETDDFKYRGILYISAQLDFTVDGYTLTRDVSSPLSWEVFINRQIDVTADVAISNQYICFEDSDCTDSIDNCEDDNQFCGIDADSPEETGCCITDPDHENVGTCDCSCGDLSGYEGKYCQDDITQPEANVGEWNDVYYYSHHGGCINVGERNLLPPRGLSDNSEDAVTVQEVVIGNTPVC